MGTVTASVYLHCPLDRVQRYLREGAAAASASGPKRLQLRSHVPVANILLSKYVDVWYAPIDRDTDDAWLVTWEPEPGGIYPPFEGRLSLRYHAADAKTILDLIGEYQPPMGEVGAAFDHVLGHQLANDTAHEFLMDLASEIRARAAYEEALAVFGHPPDTSPA